MEVTFMKQCHGCEGKGWVDSASVGPIICPICKGKGQVENEITITTHNNNETDSEPKSTTLYKQSTLKCLIPLRGSHQKIVNISRRAPKVERENAWAMTQSYRRRKDNNSYYVSIFTAGENAVILRNGFKTRDGFIPSVLSYKTSPEPEYPVSQDGFDMGISNYTQQFTLPHKYVAILDRIFSLKKKVHDTRGMEIWRELCKNGIFDIWEPIAPYHRLTGSFDLERGNEKKLIMEPQILLLRIFELDRSLDVKHEKTFTDLVTSSTDEAPLTLKRPLIPYDAHDKFYQDFQGKYTFVDIGNRIEETLDKKSVQYEEVVINDTSLIEIPS
jgi:hypothetical protein